MKRLGAIGLVMLLAASSLAVIAKSPLTAAAGESERATIHTLLKQHVNIVVKASK